MEILFELLFEIVFQFLGELLFVCVSLGLAAGIALGFDPQPLSCVSRRRSSGAPSAGGCRR